MIRICLKEENYEYDIRGLLTSFYPGEEIERAVVRIEKIPEEGGALEEGPDKIVYAIYRERELWTAFVAGGSLWGPRRAQICYEDRKQTKIILKKELYALLSAATGKTLPWGTLTGIRPTKIAMALLEEGAKEEEIAAYMREHYLTSEEKIRLSTEIAVREREILSKLDYENGYSLYLGIPFCPTTCFYCSFPSYPLSRYAGKVEDYLDCLFREIDFTAERFAEKKLNTVYIGGGTPTTLSAEQLDRLLSRLEERLSFSELKEFTVEAGRPDSITTEKLRAIRRHPVSRISINPQTMKQRTLDIIGRRHTVEQIREVFGEARALGFDNINMDLILGLPDETLEDVAHTLQEVEQLAPDNLTVHSLAVKRASRLNRQRDLYASYRMENSEAMMEVAATGAARMGMEPYYLYRQKNMSGNLENVGYALPGKAGIYNILIMEEKQSIVALGAGSTTKAVFPDGRIERADNVKDVDQYLARINEMIERKRTLFLS